MPSTTTATPVCPLCGASLPPGDTPCPNCHAPAVWQDYVRALNFAEAQFDRWQERGIIAGPNHDAILRRLSEERKSIQASVQSNKALPADAGLTPATTCWRCSRPIGSYYSYCNTCGAPLGQGADTLRYLNFVLREITRASARELTLAQAHACAADARGHAAAMRAELEKGRLSADKLASERLSYLKDLKSGVAPAEHSVPDVQPVAFAEPHVHATPPPPPLMPSPVPARTRRSVLEILLDPRSIQWLLASGGVLLVVGGVIWLASLGVFKNTMVVAVAMGAGTLLLLGGGAAVIKLTRYQLAGRALALLACLVMPLNLWFYHAHNLVTLDEHLWVAALVCCVLYAIAAAILEDPVFVYVLNAGIAMTGLLILADLHKLMQIASPVTMLVALGLIALHAERAFADNDGPFSRKRFGMACFWSAQALLAAGYLLLLGAQLAGWFPITADWMHGASSIATDPTQKILAAVLVIIGAYAYLYSDVVVRRVGVYIYFAAFNLLWAELLIIDLLHLSSHPSALIGAMAITSLVVNVVQAILLKRSDAEHVSKLARPLPAFGVLLALVPVAFGIILHFRATRLDIYRVWPYAVTWAYVVSMVLAAICCRISAYLNERKLPRVAAMYLAGTAAATLVAAAGLLSLNGLKSWPVQSPILMLIPIGYLIASRLYKDRPGQYPLLAVAHAATAVLIFSVIFSALNLSQGVEAVVGVRTNLLLALFCGEAAVFYALASGLYGEGRDVYLATAMACAGVWQVLNYFSLPTEYYCITFAAIGMALLLVYRLAALERVARPALVMASFRCANALMSLSFAAAALMTLSRLAVDRADWSLATLLAVFAVLGLAASVIVRHAGFRRFYIVLAIIESALTFIVVEKQMHLSVWQHIEMFCVGVGLILLIVGYAAWYREQETQSDAASFCLLFGGLLAGVPLAIAVLINRFWFDISLLDELALATIATLMFVTGFMCRLRATTLIGGALLGMHLAMLLVFAGMRAQLAVGAYLALGGAVLFALGVLLSVQRDRLLALPRQIREREGVFGVLAWR